MSKPLDGRAVIITGAGKSIGRAMALCLAGLGARVLVNNRSHAGEALSSAESVCEEIRAAGGDAVANLDSVEREGSAERMVEQALSAFGRLDVVIHNAAVAPEKRISGLSMDSLRQTFDINYFAPAALTRAALPALRESGNGRLIYVISNGGLYGGDGLCAYASTKAALYAHMRCAAIEGARYGITANALAPFAVSQMTDAAMQNPALREALDPSWIGPVTAVLASEAFRQTGKVFVSGGGRIREARVEETGYARFPDASAEAFDSAAEAVAKVAGMPLEAGYDNAMQAFAETMRGITRPA